jgi:hypothetical protein
VQDHVDTGQFLGDPAEQRAERADSGRGGEAEAQGSGRALVDAPGQIARCLDQRQHPASLGQERPPGLGQHHPAVVTLEQPDPYRPLEFLDLAAQRRLGHVESLGGSAEVQFLGDGDEGTQLVEREHDSRKVSLDALSALDRHRRPSLRSRNRAGSALPAKEDPS